MRQCTSDGSYRRMVVYVLAVTFPLCRYMAPPPNVQFDNEVGKVSFLTGAKRCKVKFGTKSIQLVHAVAKQ